MLPFDDITQITKSSAILSIGDTQVELPIQCNAQSTQGGTAYTCSIRNTTDQDLYPDYISILQFDCACSSAIIYSQGFSMPGEAVRVQQIYAGETIQQPNTRRSDWYGEFDYYSNGCIGLRIKNQPDTLIGFCTGKDNEGIFKIECAGNSLILHIAMNTQNLCIPAGSTLQCEYFFIHQSQDLVTCLDAYADHLAATRQPLLPHETYMGWVDWQYYRNNKTETDIRANLDVLRAWKQNGLDMRSVNIDAGYCAYNSDWLGPSSDWPSGMQGIGKDIHDAGFTFGLWFAPYITNVETRVAKEHPEWFVKEKDSDQLLILPGSPTKRSYVLDYTVPEACEWLRHLMHTFVNEWNIDYLKLDGPRYHIYTDARFADPHVTPTQVINKTLEIMYAVCADKTEIESEGCYLPSIGKVVSQRVQNDTWFYWYHPHNGKVAMRNNLQNDLLSTFLHNKVWHNHRECVAIRDFPSPNSQMHKTNTDLIEPSIPEHELESQLTTALLAGGSILISENLPLFDRSKRKALLSQIFPHCEGISSRPVNLMSDGQCPHTHVARIPKQEAYAIGVFNWNDTVDNYHVKLSDFTTEEHWHVYDAWRNLYLGCQANGIDIDDLAAHACRLFILRKNLNRPQLVGDNIQLLSGTRCSQELDWSNKCLTVEVEHYALKDKQLCIAVPTGFTLKDLDTDADNVLIDSRASDHVIIHFSAEQKAYFRISFD